MTKANDNSKKIIFIVFSMIFLIMLIFNFMTPLVCDDFAYSFSFETGERIQSVWDIIPSMAAHRTTMNGRIFSHAFAQLFLFLPKPIFNLINALFTVSLFALLLHYSKTDLPSGDLFLLVLSIFALWHFTPDFGQSFLWLDGSCNYLWSMVFTLLFLLPYYYTYIGVERHPSWWKTVLFFLLAFIAGGYLEGASSAVIFLALCFLILIRIRCKRTPVILLGGVIFAIAGFVQMMTSPAEIGRSSGIAISSVIERIFYVMYTLKEDQAALYYIWAALFAMSISCHADRKRIILSLVFMLGGILSAAVFVFALYFPGRAALPITVYTILSCMYLVSALLEVGEKKCVNILMGFLAVFFAVNFIAGTMDIVKVYEQAEQREKIIASVREAGQTVAELEIYTPDTRYSGASGLEYATENEGNMAKYYGLDKVILTESGES